LVALFYAPEPDGSHVSADGLTAFDLLSGQAVDLTLRWAWTGEPFATFAVGEYRYSLEMK
jgi:hypothetical protein